MCVRVRVCVCISTYMRENASRHTAHLGNRPDGNAQRPRRAVQAAGQFRVPIVVPIFFACEFLDCADILQSFSHFSRGGVELKSDKNETSANHEEDEGPNGRAHTEHASCVNIKNTEFSGRCVEVLSGQTFVASSRRLIDTKTLLQIKHHSLFN